MLIHSLPAGSAFWQKYSCFPPVTTVNKGAQYLIFKLAVLIFNQLHHSLLKCKLYLNLHVCVYIYIYIYTYVFFFTGAPPESSPPISTSDPCFLPVVLPAQISTALLDCTVGCQVEGTTGLKFIRFIDRVRRMHFIPDLATGQPWNMLTLFI